MTVAAPKVHGPLAGLAARYPYVLIDEILEVDSATRSIRATKNFSFSEPYFAGHFPDNPVVPGVLLIMAMLQAAELIRDGQPTRLLSAKRFHFRSPVLPGDSLLIDLATTEAQGDVWIVRASGSVRGQLRVKGALVLGTAESELGHDRRQANG